MQSNSREAKGTVCLLTPVRSKWHAGNKCQHGNPFPLSFLCCRLAGNLLSSIDKGEQGLNHAFPKCSPFTSRRCFGEWWRTPPLATDFMLGYNPDPRNHLLLPPFSTLPPKYWTEHSVRHGFIAVRLAVFFLH